MRRPRQGMVRQSPEEIRPDDRPSASCRSCRNSLVSLRDALCATCVPAGRGKQRPQGMDRGPAARTCGNLRGVVGGFSVLDNHLHVLVRLDPEAVQGWSDEDVVRRWGRLFPPRDKARRPLPVSDEWVQGHLLNVAWVVRTRQRLQSLSWFMKCLKEPLSRLVNREEQTRRAFFEGRFKSVAVLDEESLLATCAYIDLNPVAAGIAQVPEASAHMSIKERVDHVQEQGRTEDLKAARRQRGGIGVGVGSGRGPLALPDRGPAPAGFGAGRDGGRFLAGELPAAGRLHGPVVSRG